MVSTYQAACTDQKLQTRAISPLTIQTLQEKSERQEEKKNSGREQGNKATVANGHTIFRKASKSDRQSSMADVIPALALSQAVL